MLAVPVALVMIGVGRTAAPVRFAMKSRGASDDPVGSSSLQARIVVHATSAETASRSIIGASIIWMQCDGRSRLLCHPVMPGATARLQRYLRRTLSRRAA